LVKSPFSIIFLWFSPFFSTQERCSGGAMAAWGPAERRPLGRSAGGGAAGHPTDDRTAKRAAGLGRPLELRSPPSCHIIWFPEHESHNFGHWVMVTSPRSFWHFMGSYGETKARMWSNAISNPHVGTVNACLCHKNGDFGDDLLGLPLSYHLLDQLYS
jgi:hypothetical protein